MYQHFILTYSSYSYGKRIAFHKAYGSLDKFREFLAISEELKQEFKSVNFGFHHLQTDEESWSSIVEYDKFFSAVEEVKTVEQFRKLIEDDITVKPSDIVKMILAKRDCTQIDLQKLIYFIECEYILMYGTSMLKDNFEAWTYGQVIPEIYYKFKKYGSEKITLEDIDASEVFVYSRISKLKHGRAILEAVERTLEKYKDFTPGQLIDESHIKGGPWDKVYSTLGRNSVIPKELIIKDVLCVK